MSFPARACYKEQQARTQLEDMNVLTVMGTFNFSEFCVRFLKQTTYTLNQRSFEGKKFLNWESQIQMPNLAEIKILSIQDRFAVTLVPCIWSRKTETQKQKTCRELVKQPFAGFFGKRIPLTILHMISPSYNSQQDLKIVNSVSITDTAKTFNIYFYFLY